MREFWEWLNRSFPSQTQAELVKLVKIKKIPAQYYKHSWTGWWVQNTGVACLGVVSRFDVVRVLLLEFRRRAARVL